jgi:tetratricopeptide (TPR) repeat protein
LTQQEVYAKGDSIISLALALDSSLSWAWNFRAVRQLYVQDDFDGAAESVRRALAADSGNGESYRMRGILRQEIYGDLPGALVDFRHAVALGGVSLRWNSLAAGLMAGREYEEAATVLEHSMAVAPSKHSRTRLLTTYEHLGRRADATRLRREFDSTGQAAAPFEAALAASDTAAYTRARRNELRRWADSLIHRLKNPPPDAPPAERMVVAEGPIAAILCELGEPARAMDLVEQLYDSRPPRLRWIVTNVDLGCLRDDPRYLPMVKAAGLEPYVRN